MSRLLLLLWSPCGFLRLVLREILHGTSERPHNSFRTSIKKLHSHSTLRYWNKRGMLPSPIPAEPIQDHNTKISNSKMIDKRRLNKNTIHKPDNLLKSRSHHYDQEQIQQKTEHHRYRCSRMYYWVIFN